MSYSFAYQYLFNFRSPSAGKLIQFVVEDGGHVFQGESYAEIEVSVTVHSCGVAAVQLAHRKIIGLFTSWPLHRVLLLLLLFFRQETLLTLSLST